MKGNLYTIIYAASLGIACALLLTAASELTAHRRDANQQAEEMKNVLAALKIPLEEDASPEQLVDVFKAVIVEKPSVDRLADIFWKILKEHAVYEDRIAAFTAEVSAMASGEQIVSIFKEIAAREGTLEELSEWFRQGVGEIDDRYPGLTLYRYMDDSGNIVAVAVKFVGPGLWGAIKGFLALEPDMKTIRGITFYEQEETPGLGGEIATEAFTKQFEGKSIIDQQGKGGIIILTGGAERAQNEIDGITGATMTCDKVQEMLNAVITDIVEVK